jgi:hypothetical protein
VRGERPQPVDTDDRERPKAGQTLGADWKTLATTASAYHGAEPDSPHPKRNRERHARRILLDIRRGQPNQTARRGPVATVTANDDRPIASKPRTGGCTTAVVPRAIASTYLLEVSPGSGYPYRAMRQPTDAIVLYWR